MKARSATLVALLAAAAACDDVRDTQAGGGGSTTPRYERAAETDLRPGDMPVRIGELGPNFPACYAMARFRDRVVADGEAVAVRGAPFEQARETARLPASAQFFICTRSHDQRWFAAVWDEAQGASRTCGVSQPVSARRDYDGPCQSGWIPATLVRFESGIIHDEPGQANSSD
jgi:hypothetical protein